MYLVIIIVALGMVAQYVIYQKHVEFLNSRIDYWHGKYMHTLFLNQELLEKNNRVEGDEWKDLL